jgi:DNA mismatch repair protein MLH1
MVRTDHRTRTLDSFVRHKSAPRNPLVRVDSHSSHVDDSPNPQRDRRPAEADNDAIVAPMSNNEDRQWIDAQLTSILELRQEFEETSHEGCWASNLAVIVVYNIDATRRLLGLLEIFQNHTFVGVADQCHSLVQHRTKLYMINHEIIRWVAVLWVKFCAFDVSWLFVVTKCPSREYFYQLSLTCFQNFGRIQLSSPAPVRDLLKVAVSNPLFQDEETSADLNDDGIDQLVALVVAKRDMLQEYYSMEITEDAELLSLPLMLEGYLPNLDKFPLFLLRLATKVRPNEMLCLCPSFLNEPTCLS